MTKSATQKRPARKKLVADSTASASMSAEALLPVLWDGIETGLVLYDASGDRLMTNPAAVRMLGLTAGTSADPSAKPWGEGELGLGRVAGRVVYVADGMTVCPEAQWPMRRALRGEVVRTQELLICDQEHPEGRRMVVSAYPMRLLDGSLGALVAFGDVTASQHTQQVNSASLDELSMLLDGAAGYVILQLGPDGHIRSWSKNAERLLGYTSAEIVGSPYSVFFSSADTASGVPQSILAQARMHGSAKTDGARVRKDGTTFWADGVMTAVRDAAGDVSAYVKVLHDVTPRYEAERAVQKLNRELSELNEGFSYSVSHDLRAPVRAVHGFSRLLRERYLDLLPQDGQALLDQIEESAVRMGELIDGLLRLSRMQRQPMESRLVDMTALARRCWAAVEGEYPGHTPDFVLDSLETVHGDPQLLQQVWMNLLDNAMKFTSRSAHPSIQVSSRVGEDAIEFEVTDNGTGFDMRYVDKLFNVFQRLHPDDYTGVGIGLAIVYRLINRHGGRVWATGTPGRGAVFGFSLPKHPVPQTDVH